jgi:glycosyltransferase involved in cell wall biosynthesis
VASSSLLMKDFDVIAVGARFNTAEKNLISSLGFANNQVKRISSATDKQLAQLYRNAAAFVYPSLYEGFGLPPLEAMAAGCPVVCSNTSSMPEVVRNAGVYFNPLDIEDMSNAIERVVLSEDLKNKLVKLGYENIKNFTPSKTASKTLEVYRSLTGKT